LKILAVETSCDDTAVALLDGTDLLAEEIRHQDVHSAHGGVVPELASRNHLETLPSVIGDVFAKAGVPNFPGTIDVYAATAGPGLVGSLLVGLSWAKAAAWSSGKPFLGINHLAAHLFLHYGKPVKFPAAALLASGGHTCLLRMDSWERITMLGCTRDDAAGESFDKTAKLLGLGYPGGAALDALAERGDPSAVHLPSPLHDPSLPEFSFSGLKTAARIALEKGADPADLAASFRLRVVDSLVSKFLHQCREIGAASMVAAGGVTANSLLRNRLSRASALLGIPLFLPDVEHSTDNALMVGRAAAAVLDSDPSARSSLQCNAFSRWTGSGLSPLCCH